MSEKKKKRGDETRRVKSVPKFDMVISLRHSKIQWQKKTSIHVGEVGGEDKLLHSIQFAGFIQKI